MKGIRLTSEEYTFDGAELAWRHIVRIRDLEQVIIEDGASRLFPVRSKEVCALGILVDEPRRTWIVRQPELRVALGGEVKKKLV